MPNSFSVYNSCVNTVGAPTGGTPMLNLMATATSQIAISEIDSGAGATADNAAQYGIYRASARGTQATTFTPQPLDQNLTQAALTTCDVTWNAAPTTTANSQVLSWGQHQRATYRWVAYDYTKMLRTQAGTGKGLALLSIIVSSTWTTQFTVIFDE